MVVGVAQSLRSELRFERFYLVWYTYNIYFIFTFHVETIETDIHQGPSHGSSGSLLHDYVYISTSLLGWWIALCFILGWFEDVESATSRTDYHLVVDRMVSCHVYMKINTLTPSDPFSLGGRTSTDREHCHLHQPLGHRSLQRNPRHSI